MRRRAGLGAIALVLGFACGEPAAQDPAASPSPHVIATIEIGHVHSIAAGHEGIWAANYEDGELVLVDPETNSVNRRLPVARKLGSGPTAVHVIGERTFVQASDSARIGYLDPLTFEVTSVAEAGPAGILDATASPTTIWLAQHSEMKTAEPQSLEGMAIRSATEEVPPVGQKFAVYSDIAAGDAGVWALDESQGNLAAIDPPAGDPRVVTTAEPSFTGGRGDIAVGHGYVWIEASGDDTRITRYDPATSEMRSLVLEGSGGPMAIGPDALWVLTTQGDERGRLWRIDPGLGGPEPEPFLLEGEYAASDITYGFGSIWVTHDTNLLTRIGVSGGDPPAEPVPTPEPRGDAQVCDQSGPWSYCAEARWLRRVLLDAGLEVTGDTGSALQAISGTHRLYAWNTDADPDLPDMAAEEGYETSDGDVYSDGYRIVWEAQGLHIYISSADERPIDELSDEVVDKLVEASRSVPMAADLSGAKPQPTPTAEQRFEMTDDGRVRVWPVTEDVEDEGTYLFHAPHCGLDWMLDFDASFWRTIKPDDYGKGDNYPFFYNSDEGAITFVDSNSAIYQASTGERIRIERLAGPIVIDPCA